jgi:IclR family transcriptional regulator, acetate operon repressor
LSAVEAQPKKDLIQSVQRACRVLHLLAAERRPLAVREIAERLELNLATCYHLLNTLEHERFLARDGRRRLALGYRIGELHDAFEAMLAPDDRLLELLGELNRRTGETTYLGTWDGDEVVSVAVREGSNGVRVRGLYLGYREHGYARAAGRALLAQRDDGFVDRYLEGTRLEPLTDRTTVDPAALRELLADARTHGYAVELEEFTPGVCCAAAPIFDAEGRAAYAFSVSIPKARFDAEGESLVREVKQAAAAASERLQTREETTA